MENKKWLFEANGRDEPQEEIVEEVVEETAEEIVEEIVEEVVEEIADVPIGAQGVTEDGRPARWDGTKWLESNEWTKKHNKG